MVAYEPSGIAKTFTHGGCPVLSFGSWYPTNATGVQVSLGATGTSPGTCTVDFSDGVSTQTPAPDAGQVTVEAVGCPFSGTTGIGIVGVGQSCTWGGFPAMSFYADCGNNPGEYYYEAGFAVVRMSAHFGSITTSSPYGALTSSEPSNSSGPATFTFTRTAPGAVTVYIYGVSDAYSTSLAGSGGLCLPYINAAQLGSLTIN